jgi:hypothetical protein
LQVATFVVVVQVPRQGALDVPRSCVMALDQVAVIRVHHPNEVGKVGCGLGIERLAKRRRRRGDLRNHVRDW